MPFRPNYRQARGERDRAKQQNQQEKLRKREEDAARRKGEHEPGETAIDDGQAGSAPQDESSTEQ